MGNKRNGKVEFWRFIFSVIIVLHHSRSLVGDENCLFLGGSLAVEFFFLVSGYLMMASVARMEEKDPERKQLGNETLTFVLRKAKSVFPALLIAWFMALAVVTFARDMNFFELAVDSFFEMTLLKMSGLPSLSVNGVVWYISSMLICMALLYPLIRKFPEFMKNIGLLLIVVLGLGYLGGSFSNPRDPLRWLEFTKKGNVRALAEIALGAMTFVAVQRCRKVELTCAGKWVATLAEWALYLGAILYMYYEKAGSRDYFVLLMIAVAVGLSFSHMGVDAKLFDNGFFGWLGQYSFYLFLGHTFIAQNLNYILPKGFSNGKKIAVYLACAVVTSFVIWGLTVLVKKCKLPQLAKKLFVKAEK